jgi:hypothetical protein
MRAHFAHIQCREDDAADGAERLSNTMMAGKHAFDYAFATGLKGFPLNLPRHRELERQSQDQTNRVAQDERTSVDDGNAKQVGAGTLKSSR